MTSKQTLRKQIGAALRAAVASFRAVPKLVGFSRPVESLSLESVFSEINVEDDVADYDYVFSGYPWGYASRSLLGMAWEGWMCGGVLNYSAIQLDGCGSLYFRNLDSEVALVAFSKLQNRKEGDRLFLEALLRSNGRTFGEGILESPPTNLSAKVEKKALPELLYLTFKDAHKNFGDHIWHELIDFVADRSDREVDWSRLLQSCEGKLCLVREYVRTVGR